MKYFTSYPHYFHDNIIKYCGRPCTLENHTEFLINFYNSRITEDDEITIIGDLTGNKNKQNFKKLVNVFERLKGTWRLIKGNHDIEGHLIELSRLFPNVKYLGTEHQEVINNIPYIMYHFPIESWDKKYYNSIHLHGHIHNKNYSIQKIPNRFNVCLDNELKLYDINYFERNHTCLK